MAKEQQKGERKRDARKRSYIEHAEYLRMHGAQYAEEGSATVYSSLDEITKVKLGEKRYNTNLHVVNMDTLDAARLFGGKYDTRVACLDMASSNPRPPRDRYGRGFGGGVGTGASAQEEQIFYRTSIAAVLEKEELDPPVPPFGGVYCKNIAVIRSTEDDSFRLLPEEDIVHVDIVMAAALHRPRLEKDGRYTESQRNDMVSKIRAMLHILAQNGNSHVVLGAFGCGAYGNPSLEVAQLFQDLLFSPAGEFYGVFEVVVFAILAKGKDKNYDVYKRVLQVHEGQED